MIQALLLGLGVLVLLVIAANWYANAQPREIKRTLLWVGVILLVALIVFLAMTGKLAWAIGAIGGLVAWVMRFVRAGFVFQALRGLLGMAGARSDTGGTGQSRQRSHNDAMTEEEAWKLLGLEPGASDEEIHAAYRRLVSKLHPDTGGNDYLASKLNQARDVLIGRRG